jgi:hypothetical protein
MTFFAPFNQRILAEIRGPDDNPADRDPVSDLLEHRACRLQGTDNIGSRLLPIGVCTLEASCCPSADLPP